MISKDESGSVVWAEEMAEAFGVAYKLIEAGDTVQARMAFIEAYKDRCAKSRDAGAPVQWSPSLGHDPHGREHVIMEAVEKGRLTAKHVSGLLPIGKVRHQVKNCCSFAMPRLDWPSYRLLFQKKTTSKLHSGIGRTGSFSMCLSWILCSLFGGYVVSLCHHRQGDVVALVNI
ncbi:hypothetical protein [Nitrosomonas sp. Nm166]|uniref:hypothetical protein n=1 Tax=Nitrosomonas sp. Nm166 TaxID=1881054 RepID=UPI0008EC6696|nr:hypothetical protein [Nitrosomonas sp. Nm166]SFE10987.1 hypothetical protein SAMN05428977_10072 [Nitrosomonas sp. Nm166]